MSISIRLEEADQTTFILVEGDCVAVRVFYGDPRDEDLNRPDGVLLFGAEALERFATALFQARIALERESVAEFFRVMNGGFGYEAP